MKITYKFFPVFLALSACGSSVQKEAEMMSSTSDGASSALTNRASFVGKGVNSLEAALTRSGHKFEINQVLEPSLIPRPSTPECKDLTFDKFFYLIIENLEFNERYRVFILDDNIVCLEPDFGYKNPYQK
ncbi:hypothetical protein [Sphingopyxis sp. OAS728]|uniref:hypothetical protein n=1 Tax=Sphingopyxis sp. OAS728 TaxID=2663823 RepID=UPI00178B584A|nr:hypothetical protein [Sphingopyxis sp. OAS728]